jgi:preprotein translocase subunit Sss1
VGEKMMEVMAALSAVNTAIKVVKATVSTCQNLESLGPCLSQFFGAKEQAIAVVKKGGFKGSALGQAVELELAIEQAKAFELEVKNLFFPNNMDVWQRIVARSKQITSDQIQADKRAREAAARRKAEIEEIIEIVLFIVITIALLGTIGYFVYEAVQQCEGRCGFQR